MSKDNSPDIRVWVKTRKSRSNTFPQWIKSLLPKITCREVWLSCQDVWQPLLLTYYLKTLTNYRPVQAWFWAYRGVPSADEFRQKCAELGCYGKEVY